MLIQIAQPFLVVQHIVGPFRRGIGQAEHVDWHAVANGVVVVDRRVHRTHAIGIQRGLRGGHQLARHRCRQLRVSRVVALHVANNVAGIGIANRIDRHREAIDAQDVLGTGGQFRLAVLVGAAQVPVVGEKMAEAAAGRPHLADVAVVTAVGDVGTTRNADLADFLDLDGREILRNHGLAHRIRQERVLDIRRDEVGLAHLERAQTVVGIGLGATGHHLREQLGALAQIVLHGPEGIALHDFRAICAVDEGVFGTAGLWPSRLHAVGAGARARRNVAVHEGTHALAVIRKHVTVERKTRLVDEACGRLRGRMHVRPGDALGHVRRGGGRNPGRIDDPADAVPVPGFAGVAIDLVRLADFQRTDHVQTLADAPPAGHGDMIVLAISPFGDAAADTGFQALEFPIEHEIDDAGHGIGTVGSGGTTGYDINRTQQRGRKIVHVHCARAVRRHDARAIEQHQRALLAHVAQVQIAATGVAEEGCSAPLRRLGVQELGQVVELFGNRSARLVVHDLRGGDRGDRSRLDHAIGGANATAGDLDLVQDVLRHCRAGDESRGYRQSHGRGPEVPMTDYFHTLPLTLCGPLFWIAANLAC